MLKEMGKIFVKVPVWSLNPYFNGTCSKRFKPILEMIQFENSGLNPYFNGTCSKSYVESLLKLWQVKDVLILILMEHAQREIIIKR